MPPASLPVVRILLTNDDGIHAPGLAALEKALARLGTVGVVAPHVEQSGVGHSVTYRKPLMIHEAASPDDPRRLRGWSVEGSPADCVKLGVLELVRDVDVVVSGINDGLNAGINVLYSGTVAAAIEGAFFGITSVAVSLESDDRADWPAAAELAVTLIEQLLARGAGGHPPCPGELFNLNIPTAALTATPEVRAVPLGLLRYGDRFIKRLDPRGKPYFWTDNDPPAPPGAEETDLMCLRRGAVTVTPLHFDMTDRGRLATMPTKLDWTV